VTSLAEPTQHVDLATVRDVEHTAAFSSPDQAGRHGSVEQRGAELTGDVGPALAPIEAKTAGLL
jgi:hypothetical protein